MATTLTGRASAWSCHEVAWAVAAGEPPRLSHLPYTPILACMRSGTPVVSAELSACMPETLVILQT